MLPSLAWADLTGWIVPGTVVDETPTCWSPTSSTLVAAMASDDNNYAEDTTSCIDSLLMTNFFTTGDVPAGSTIISIQVRIIDIGADVAQANRRRLDIYVQDEAGADTPGGIQLYQMARNAEQTTTFTQDDDLSALWSTTWVAADVVDPDFGVRLNHTDTNAVTNRVEMIEMQIEFTPPGGRSRFHIIGWLDWFKQALGVA